VETVHTSSTRLRDRTALAVFTAVSLVLLTVYLTGSVITQQAAILGASTAALVAVVTGLRIHRVPDQRPWLLVAVGLTLLTVVNALTWTSSVLHQHVQTWPVAPFQLAGYLAMLAASVMVVLRRAPHDSGGVIDSAVVGIATAAPVWEFVLRPALAAAGSTTGGRALALTQILVLFGILGSLRPMSRAFGRRQVGVWLLFSSLSCAVLGDLVTAVGEADGSRASLSGVTYMLGYLLMGGATLHRTITTLTQPVPVHGDGVRKLRLGLFGGALVVIPLVGGIPQLFGAAPDGPLLTLGPLLMVPLVLFRVGQLMTLRAQDQRDLAYQANHDHLTGLVNRRRVFAAITQAMAGGADRHRPPATVLFCDLDDFKPINDRFGHDAGDAVLQCVARRITATLREQDVVARIGGDEFLAYCPDADEATAAALRQRLEDVLCAPIDWNGTTLRVGATIGVAVTGPGRYTSPDELIAAADTAMYERKRVRKSTRTAARPVRPAWAAPEPLLDGGSVMPVPAPHPS
jgi:diguanylate cyclase (GGDEF)-like protein